jgi:hypothetical protein
MAVLCVYLINMAVLGIYLTNMTALYILDVLCIFSTHTAVICKQQ